MPGVKIKFEYIIKDEASNAIYQDSFGNWADNIGIWQSSEGYIVYMDSNQNLQLTTKAVIDLPLTIDLDFGWNILSYPIQNSDGVDIESVLSELISEASLTAVFNQKGGVYVPSYQTIDGETLNSISSMNKNEGYYVNVNTDTELTILEPEYSELLITNNENSFNNENWSKIQLIADCLEDLNTRKLILVSLVNIQSQVYKSSNISNYLQEMLNFHNSSAFPLEVWHSDPQEFEIMNHGIICSKDNRIYQDGR